MLACLVVTVIALMLASVAGGAVVARILATEALALAAQARDEGAAQGFAEGYVMGLSRHEIR